MKLVILAAGKGKRMGESSKHTPKPILLYKGRTLIDYKLENMPAGIEEVIIVIGHLGEKIMDTVGKSYTNKASGNLIPITYVKQEELLGTAHALHQTKNAIGNSPFLVLMGDDIYDGQSLQDMVEHFNSTKEWSVLLEKSARPVPYGKCIVDERGYLREIKDDPQHEIQSDNMYTGACLLTPDFFEIPMAKYANSTEYGLPYTFITVADSRNIKAYYTENWKRITAPEDLTD